VAVFAGVQYVAGLLTTSDWVSGGAGLVVAAITTFAIGRALNRHENEHTFCLVPAQWIGLLMPTVFGVFELIYRLNH
jgi:hypothetical protein